MPMYGTNQFGDIRKRFRGGILQALSTTRAPYTGPVANRFVGPTVATGNSPFMSSIGFYWTDSGSSVVVRIPTYNGNGDVRQTSLATYHASIEYPAGVFNEIKWGGASTVTLTSIGADTGPSDALALNYVAGDQAKFHCYAVKNGAGTIACAQGSGNSIRWTAGGDASQLGSATDKTLVGGQAHAGTDAFIMPLILGTTTKPTFGAVGDSTTLGSGSGTDAFGQTGEIARSFGKSYAVINVGIGGSTLTAFNTTGIDRAAMANYAAIILNHYLKNDYRAAGSNRSAALMQGDWDAFPYWFPGKPIVGVTIGPVTDASNTTTDASNANRVTLNAYISSTPYRYSGPAIDLGGYEEQGATGLFKSGYTVDGLHLTEAGYLGLTASGLVVPGSLNSRTAVGFAPTGLKTNKPGLYFDVNNASRITGTNSNLQAIGNSGALNNTTANPPNATSFAGSAGMATNPGELLGDQNLKNFSSGVGALTMAALVMMTATPSAERAVFGATISGSNTERAFIFLNAARVAVLRYRRLDADAATTLTGTIAIPLNTPVLLEGVFDATNNVVRLYVNGVLDGTGTFAGGAGNFSATSSNNIVMGTLTGNKLSGIYSQLGMFDKALTTTERQMLEGEMAWRAGVAATVLPSGHPYLSARP